MHWSQTVQLLCNTPTMIIEGPPVGPETLN